MKKITKGKLRPFIKEYTGLFSFIILMVFFRKID